MSGDHNQYQKSKSYLDDFECPRCGHCCQVDGQEPVAWMTQEATNGTNVWLSKKQALKFSSTPTPLYIAPVDGVTISEERADETAKGEHEPVAWLYVNKDGECEQIEFGPVPDDPSVTPLYAAPQKREWVGLTEKEIRTMAKPHHGIGINLTGRMWVFIADLTDKLQEKNHG